MSLVMCLWSFHKLFPISWIKTPLWKERLKKTYLSYINSCPRRAIHYNDVIMGSVASQITSLTIVYSAVYSGAYQRKLQSSASLVFVRVIYREPFGGTRPMSSIGWCCTSASRFLSLSLFGFSWIWISGSSKCSVVSTSWSSVTRAGAPLHSHWLVKGFHVVCSHFWSSSWR